MARHPEVSEAEIISAGSKLISQGKTPNPGAIRAALHRASAGRNGLGHQGREWGCGGVGPAGFDVAQSHAQAGHQTTGGVILNSGAILNTLIFSVQVIVK